MANDRIILEIRGDKSSGPIVKEFADSFKGGSGSTTRSVNRLEQAFTAFSTSVVAYSAYRAVKDILQVGITMDSLERSMKAATGSQDAARESLDFLRETSNRLGISFQDTVRPFMQLTASAKGTRLEGEGVRDAFLAVAEASAVLGLSASQTERVVYAMQQMISKGKVSAEELRQQLGDQLPGAAQIAARAMGVSVSKFNQMLDEGKIVSQDFIPKFVKQLRQEFAGGVADASNSAQAETNRLRNAMWALKEVLSKEILPAFVAFLNTVAPTLQKSAEGLAIMLGATERTELENRRIKTVEDLRKVEADLAAWKRSAAKVGPSLADAVIGSREDMERIRADLTAKLLAIQEALNKPAGGQPSLPLPFPEKSEDRLMERLEERAQLEQAKAWESLTMSSTMEKFMQENLDKALTDTRAELLKTQVGTMDEALSRRLSDHSVYLEVRKAQTDIGAKEDLKIQQTQEKIQYMQFKSMARDMTYVMKYVAEELDSAYWAFQWASFQEVQIDTSYAAYEAFMAVKDIPYVGYYLAIAAAAVTRIYGYMLMNKILHSKPGDTFVAPMFGASTPTGAYPASPTTGLPEEIPHREPKEEKPSIEVIIRGPFVGSEEALERFKKKIEARFN